MNEWDNLGYSLTDTECAALFARVSAKPLWWVVVRRDGRHPVMVGPFAYEAQAQGQSMLDARSVRSGPNGPVDGVSVIRGVPHPRARLVVCGMSPEARQRACEAAGV